MKKVALLGLVLILLAASAVPVLAAGNGSNGNGNGNGHGNGVSAGQTDNQGNGDQTRDRDQIRLSKPNKSPNRGASGAQNNMRMRTPFYLQGTLTAVNTGTMTVTVSLTHGSAPVKLYIGNTLNLQASTTTMIFKLTQGDESEDATQGSTSSSVNDDEGPSAKVAISLADLANLVNDHPDVAIHGNLVNNVFTVRLITVYIRPPLGETVETP